VTRRRRGGGIDVTFAPQPGQGRHEPVFNIPAVIVAIVCLLFAVEALRQTLSASNDLALVKALAFVPARVTAWFWMDDVVEHLKALAATGEEGARAAIAGSFFIGDGELKPWTALTYAALHGGWAHAGVNSLWLIAFGSPVARRFGVARFLALFAICALAGAFAHFLTNMYDATPVVGASASVSGAMGAATRFVFQPGAALGQTMAPTADPHAAPALPLSRLISDRRVTAFLVVWFVMNFVFGSFAAPLGLSDAPIAWQAHVGGFLAGLLLFALFDPDRAPRLPDV
jgi:membrane associated rhomboid family serine protease